MLTEQERYEQFLRKYRLNELANENDIKIIKKMFDENLQSLWLYPDGMTLLGTDKTINDVQLLQTRYLATIVEQNFIMIRQLERISKAVGGEPEPRKLTKAEEYLKAKQDAVKKH